MDPGRAEGPCRLTRIIRSKGGSTRESDHLVRALVSPLSALLPARQRTGGRTRGSGGCQLHLALGTGVCAGVAQALPSLHLKPSNKELDHRTVKKRVWLAKRSNPFKWRHCPGDIVMSCVRYLNNVVEQDHRNVTRRTWLAAGYGSVPTAWRTLRGIEAMDMIRKGRARRATKRGCDRSGEVHWKAVRHHRITGTTK